MTQRSSHRLNTARRLNSLLLRRIPCRPLLAAALGLAISVPAVEAQHDCVEYEPTMAGAVVNDDWQSPFEVDNYQIDVPADPGGGYVVASLSSQAPSQPGMRIIPPSGLGVVAQIAPTQPESASPQTIEVAFEVAGGTTFMVEVSESTVATMEAHPILYTWSWSFVSKVDCYEPNDGDPTAWPEPVPNARQIPLNEIHEAFSLAGHLSFGIPTGSAHTYDWYEFTLAVPTSIWAATVSVPSDQSIRLRIFGDDDGLVDITGSPPPVGSFVTIGPQLLAAGTYYLEVVPVDRGLTNVATSEGEALPDHFVTPYEFIVGTGPAIPCEVFGFIFCDDFETGDTSLWSLAVP